MNEKPGAVKYKIKPVRKIKSKPTFEPQVKYRKTMFL